MVFTGAAPKERPLLFLGEGFFGGGGDVALFEFGVVDDVEAGADDGGGEEDGPGGLVRRGRTRR
jgi:hypothetical protein